MAARLAFVLSHDYGELFNAVYFALGGTFESLLLLPPRLYQSNAGMLPVTALSYRDVGEIAAHLDRVRPDAVVFFSGYLFVINKLLGEAELGGLLRYCQDRRWKIVTSDPSLGLVPSGEVRFQVDFAAAKALEGHFAWLREQFAEAFHVYLAPNGIAIDTSHGSYFNPRCVLSATELEQRSEKLATWSAIDRGLRRWLFVLSPEDDAIQAATLGRAEFTRQLANRLRDVEIAGRQGVIIAPSACLTALVELSGLPEGCIALNACSYLRFMLLLHEAEYVFYWNVFSASMLARVINRQPIFTFAPGHLTSALREVGEIGRQHFYLGQSPTALDLARPLLAEELESLAAEQQRALLAPVSAYLARSMTPDQLVNDILGSRNSP